MKWKLSKICPIYKIGPKNNAANHRAICLTSAICKTVERIVIANILQYVKAASFLSDTQHGFVPRHSCLTSLIIAEEFITDTTGQAEPVDVVYLVFLKALDSVCHRLLVKKVAAMGVQLKITRWIE